MINNHQVGADGPGRADAISGVAVGSLELLSILFLKITQGRVPEL